MLAALAFAGASAFCAAQAAPASDSGTGPAAKPADSATPSAERAADSAEPAVKPPIPRIADIALVLPLESPDYLRAAEAVRDGFLAAAQSAGASVVVRVVGHGDGDVLAGFETAKSLGVRVIVGPLVRDDLRALARSEEPLPVTLALNQLDDGATLPPQVYTLALAVESDARLLVRRMRADNLRSVIVIGSEVPLMKRFAGAFAAEWLLAGGGEPVGLAFERAGDGLANLRREVAKSIADGALIALDGSEVALARSFVPRLPAYANSPVDQALEPAALRDLEGVVFVDIPWIVAPNQPALAKLPRRSMANPVLDRLYALGLDAFRVARAFVDAVPEQLQFQGATGMLTLANGRQFTREGALAVIRGGQVVPADGAR